MRIPITIYPPHICIQTQEFVEKYKQNFKIIKEYPQSSMKLTDAKQEGLTVFLSDYRRTQTHTNTPTYITMSQSDAENMGYKQGQKVNFTIPYKNITLPNIKIRIKDYFLPDLFIMQDEAEKLDIADGDWGIITS